MQIAHVAVAFLLIVRPEALAMKSPQKQSITPKGMTVAGGVKHLADYPQSFCLIHARKHGRQFVRHIAANDLI